MSDVEKKYEIVDGVFDANSNKTYYRIKALRDFYRVNKGDIGGFVESENNLSHTGNCWIFDDAYVVDNAKVYDNAVVRNNVWVFDNAQVFGHAVVRHNARVYQYAKVFDSAEVTDNANVYQTAQVFGHAIVHGEARLRFAMTATTPITVVNNTDTVITVADKQMHVYKSKIYHKDEYPKKYRKLLLFLDNHDE